MQGLGFADENLLPKSTAFDHQSLISQLSKDLVLDIQHTGPPSGPDHQLPIKASVRKNSNPIKKNLPKEEGCATVEEEEESDEEEKETPQKNPLKECRISRPEVLLKKQEQRRLASLEKNGPGRVTSSSPRLAAMKKASAAAPRRTGALLNDGMWLQKGNDSEGVALQSNCSRVYGNAAMLPFNNGRSLPWKWEDAEKWIFSPVAGDSRSRLPLVPPQQRRPISKSGPLGGMGIANYSAPTFDGGKVLSFKGSSPFSAGVLAPDAFSGQVFGGGRGGERYCAEFTERCITRSASANLCSDTLIQSSLPKDEKDGTKDAGSMFSPAPKRRDRGTQMSPVHSTDSPPKGRHCSASGSSVLTLAELRSNHPSKLEVKDVQVDDHVTLAKRLKKDGAQGLDRFPTNNRERKKKVVGAQASYWEKAETEKCISKVRRDEANIMAWENLQKAKAEAEIRKLEMKLEKMRTSSMNKIMNKLRLAQRKAQEMRSSVSNSQVHEVSITAKKTASFCKFGHIGSLTGCFTCRAV